MRISFASLDAWWRTLRTPAILPAYLLLAGVAVPSSQTLNAQQTPYAMLQSSSVVATGNTISVTRVPVVIGPNSIIYKDLVLQFDVDVAGNFTLTSGFPQINDSPTMLASSIVPGKYVGPLNVNQGQNVIVITGPAVLPGGVLAYTFTISTSGSNQTYPSQGTFYVGSLAQVPIADRLKSAGITSPAWSYGLATGNNNYSSSWVAANMIIGVNQIGNTLTIASFSTGGNDKGSPTDQIVYTLAQ